MLNDTSRRTRLLIFLQTLGPGVLLGGAVGLEAVTTGTWIVFGIAALLPLSGLVAAVSGRRLERRFWEDVAAGSEEILAGAVRTVSVPGRAVRHRLGRGLPHYALAAGRGADGRDGMVLAVTVVGDGPPRRVGLLAPALPALRLRDAPLVVALHPDRPEVGVLDDRVSAAGLAAAVRDPRWAGPLPTDGSVVGGGAALLGCAAAGLAAGAVAGFALMTLAT